MWVPPSVLDSALREAKEQAALAALPTTMAQARRETVTLSIQDADIPDELQFMKALMHSASQRLGVAQPHVQVVVARAACPPSCEPETTYACACACSV